MEPSQQPISMLIVEDDNVTREVIGIMLPRKFPGIDTYVAENGMIGLQRFKEHLSQIVITDIQMPVMDGIEMAIKIKSIKPDTKFIVLTAYSNTGYYEKFKEIGFHDFLAKPIEFDMLFAAIERCITEIKIGT